MVDHCCGRACDVVIPKKSRLALFAALAAAMLLTSGTAGVALATTAATPATNEGKNSETIDGDKVIEEFRDRIDSLETVQFTQTEEVSGQQRNKHANRTS